MKRILIVDDERDILESMSQLLEAYGYIVETCNERSRVLEIMHNKNPDIVLHDVRMPGLDIQAQLQAIRRDPALRDTPVILLTATLLAKDFARDVGADDAIEKPFEPEALRSLLRFWETGGSRRRVE